MEDSVNDDLNKRVAFLEGDMSRAGGTERMTATLANALCQEYSVFVISIQLAEPELFFPLNSSVEMLVLPESSTGIVGKIFQLRKLLLHYHINWLINVDVGTAIYGIPAAFGLKTRVITWEHGNYYNNWGSRWFPYFRRFAAKCSDAVVVLTEKDRGNYLAHIKTRKPIYVIPNPVIKQAYRYDLNSKMILSAGLLVPIKGFDQAIEAAAVVLKKYPDWKWVICGEGPERGRLEGLIEANELIGKVLLPGSVRDMTEYYRKAAMFVMTSGMEGLPMVLLEAKSWGLPIVSYNIMTGPSEIIRDGVNGFLITPEDISELEARIIELIANRDKRKRFSEMTELDMERFSRDSVIEKWLGIIE